MGLKKTWNGWVWEDETTTPHMTWTSTETTGDPIEIKAPEWKPDKIVINSPTWEYKTAIPQGWVCPKCGRVNAPSVEVCPCSTAYIKAEDWLANTEVYVPAPCRECSNHPSNGGSGICHCTLGTVTIY